MVALALPSNITEAEIVQLVISFLLGLLIGILVRKFIALGAILAAIVILLMVAGYVSPQQIEALLNSFLMNLQSYAGSAQEIVKFIPYNSIAFLIGFVIGLAKG
ncbi:hypothetical protein DDW10_03425 [Sulfolobales archaeon SCGC AB-777_J03]|nr:hypothetical protein DDW10_03425 [Sulfolobales archaeon SCGC AB-777_J03]